MNGSFVWFRIGKGVWNCSSKITNNTVLFPDVRGDSDTPRHIKVADRYASELAGSGYDVRRRHLSPSELQMGYLARP